MGEFFHIGSAARDPLSTNLNRNRSFPAREPDHDHPNLAKTAGFSLHAGVAAKAHQRRKLERLCRYIARTAVATDRLALTPQGNVRYTLKTPYRDGTTHIILEPLDFMYRMYGMPRAQDAQERSSLGRPPWCRSRVSTSSVSTACSHPTAHCDTT